MTKYEAYFYDNDKIVTTKELIPNGCNAEEASAQYVEWLTRLFLNLPIEKGSEIKVVVWKVTNFKDTVIFTTTQRVQSSCTKSANKI